MDITTLIDLTAPLALGESLTPDRTAMLTEAILRYRSKYLALMVDYSKEKLCSHVISLEDKILILKEIVRKQHCSESLTEQETAILSKIVHG